MKPFFRKYAVPVIAVICVLALCGAWTGVRLSADAGTYRLDDIEGDASYLDGIRIDMSLFDAAHTQHITLADGRLSHSYEYMLPFQTPLGLSYFTSQTFVEHEDANVEVETDTVMESSGADYEVWVTRMTRTADKARISVFIERIDYNGSYSPMNWVQVVTDVTVSSADDPFVFSLQQETEVYKGQTTAQGEPLPDTTYAIPFNYETVQQVSDDMPINDYEVGTGYNRVLYVEAANGTVYFTPALRPYHGGTSAIYRVDEWGGGDYDEEPTMMDGYLCYSDGNAKAIGSVTKLAEFPVDGHELRTVALDVVDDKLCLLLVADGTLTLRVYGLDGAFQDEIPLFEVDPDQEFASTLFSNRNDGATMLCYYLQNAFTDEFGIKRVSDEGSSLLCVRLGERAELMSLLPGRDTLMRAAFIGDYWVLAETEQVDYSYGDSSMIPERHYISVLDASGAMLYRGEIMTDQQQDDIQDFVNDGTEPRYDLYVHRLFTFDDITEG